MAYEDFTTFSEQDPNSRITLSTTKCLWTLMPNNEDSWAYYDYGANHFDGDYEQLFEYEFDTSNTTIHVIWMLSNTVEELLYHQSQNKDCINLYRYISRLDLYCIDGAVDDVDASSNLALDTVHYITCDRDDDGDPRGS